MVAPPQAVIDAIEAPTSEITRRVSIFEADGKTPWTDAGTDSRLVDGNIGIDGSRDERRSLELTLSNSDEALVHDPDGFWFLLHEGHPSPARLLRCDLRHVTDCR